MKFPASLIVHAIIGVGVISAVVIARQPADVAKPIAPPAPGLPAADPNMDPAKAMEEWMALSKPGEPHKFLKKLEGQYTTTSRMWMDPTQPPMESKGKATFTMTLNGHFLKQDFEGTMMGMPMTGFGLMGYDNYRRQYIGTWADSMSTTIFHMSGGISRDGKTITMFGAMDEPGLKEIGKTVKWVNRFVDNDTMFFEAWEVQYGDPFKAFEVEYRRVK